MKQSKFVNYTYPPENPSIARKYYYLLDYAYVGYPQRSHDTNKIVNVFNETRPYDFIKIYGTDEDVKKYTAEGIKLYNLN